MATLCDNISLNWALKVVFLIIKSFPNVSFCKSCSQPTGQTGSGPVLTQGWGLPIPELEGMDYFYTIYTFPELIQKEV